MVSLMFPMIDGEQCPITPSPKMKHLPETIEWGWFEGDGIKKLPFLVYTKFILPISDKIVMGGISTVLSLAFTSNMWGLFVKNGGDF